MLPSESLRHESSRDHAEGEGGKVRVTVRGEVGAELDEAEDRKQESYEADRRREGGGRSPSGPSHSALAGG